MLDDDELLMEEDHDQWDMDTDYKKFQERERILQEKKKKEVAEQLAIINNASAEEKAL